MKVPFFDPSFENSNFEGAALERFARVFRSNRFVLGEEVAAFEREMAEKFSVEEAIGVSSGTDALLLSLLALRLEPGSEVVTTPLTFVATSEAIVRAGLRPVFVDVDEFGNLDPELARAAIGPKTRALLPVHLFGRPAHAASFETLAREKDIFLVEDAAQALGAVEVGKNIGTFGSFAALSFFPTKPLGGFGDGGMVFTSGKFAAEIRALRQHGSDDKRTFRTIGGNFRLDELQAALLRLKLAHFEELSNSRAELARRYDALLSREGAEECGIRSLGSPLDAPSRHAHHLFVVEVPERDRVRRALAERGVAAAVYYDVPLDEQPCFANVARSHGVLRRTRRFARSLLALPFFPKMGEESQEYVVRQLVGCVRETLE